MSQIIGNPSRNTTGVMLSLGPGGIGQVLVLTGSADPGTINDGGDKNAGCVSAAPGSIFLRTNGMLYLKSTDGTWKTVTVT